jgi:hypothetical protein
VWQRNPTTLSPAATIEPAGGDATDWLPDPQLDLPQDDTDTAGKPAGKD